MSYLLIYMYTISKYIKYVSKQVAKYLFIFSNHIILFLFYIYHIIYYNNYNFFFYIQHLILHLEFDAETVKLTFIQTIYDDYFEEG